MQHEDKEEENQAEQRCRAAANCLSSLEELDRARASASWGINTYSDVRFCSDLELLTGERRAHAALTWIQADFQHLMNGMGKTNKQSDRMAGRQNTHDYMLYCLQRLKIIFLLSRLPIIHRSGWPMNLDGNAIYRYRWQYSLLSTTKAHSPHQCELCSENILFKSFCLLSCGKTWQGMNSDFLQIIIMMKLCKYAYDANKHKWSHSHM